MVSVVIAARNAAHTIEQQLEALGGQDYASPWEVIVADNGSTDGTAEVTRGWASPVPLRVVTASARRGAGFARNQGWKASHGDLVAFCDADDMVSSSWLSHLTAAAEHTDLVGGPYEFERLNASKRQPWWDGTTLPLGWDFLPFSVGGNLAAWADALTTLGGFNESYSRLQDVDLCWRAQLASLRLDFAPEAIVHCRYRTRLTDTASQAYSLGYHTTHLYRDFRAHGMPRSDPRRLPHIAGELVKRAPAAAISHAQRSAWIPLAAEQLGRLTGSIRYRTFYP
jgi:glycosyltransferase involved in cell wall biosynthesis